jgi:hypothetical protein
VEVANDNETLELSYLITECFIYINNIDGYENIYYVDYRILLYPEYTFAQHSAFANLTTFFLINNRPIYWGEERCPFLGYNIMLIKFTYGEYDYFLSITSFLEVDLERDDLIPLMQVLFGER